MFQKTASVHLRLNKKIQLKRHKAIDVYTGMPKKYIPVIFPFCKGLLLIGL